jgi:transcriptional regulator with XRE-family HTH domain
MDHRILGTRLKRSREAIDLSQGAFAKALGLSSEYISLLEAGKRTPSLETLDKISSFLNKDLTFFFERERRVFDALLGDASLNDRGRKDLQKFRALCEKDLELEEAAGRRLDLAPLYSLTSPERLAEEERRRIGLGQEPIRDIFRLCEANGCRIFRVPLAEESRISGAFVYDGERRAAFALINANEPAGLQVTIAAHEYAHYLKDRTDGPIIDNPDVVLEEYVSLYPPREIFAQAFASRFLIPPSKLGELVEKNLRGRSLSYEDVLVLKRYFGVSTRALLRALRAQSLIAPSKFEEFFKRNPETRESEVFGAASGMEEQKSRALFRKPRPKVVVSDRSKLLRNLSESQSKAEPGGVGKPDSEGG